MSSYAVVILDQHLQAHAGSRTDGHLSRRAADRHALLEGLRDRSTASVHTLRRAGRLRRLLVARSRTGTSAA